MIGSVGETEPQGAVTPSHREESGFLRQSSYLPELSLQKAACGVLLHSQNTLTQKIPAGNPGDHRQKKGQERGQGTGTI